MPIGCSSVQLVRRLAHGVQAGEPALLHARRGQRGEADHVADGVDVLDRGAEVLVDLDPAAVVRVQPGLVQVELVGGALAARPSTSPSRRGSACRWPGW